jgi:hypothetical protein
MEEEAKGGGGKERQKEGREEGKNQLVFNFVSRLTMNSFLYPE